jgi:Ca2+-binding EF-hand superfamily protein
LDAFKLFDINHDGKIDPGELRALMVSIRAYYCSQPAEFLFFC